MSAIKPSITTTNRVARFLSGCAKRSKVIIGGAVLTVLTPLVLAAQEPPKRVVSINLCTDQLAMLLAAEGQLISVSWLARDPVSSSMSQEAMKYEPNLGQAEQIYLMQPDLVLAGGYSNPLTLDLLRRLGIPLAILPNGSGLADVPSQMAFVAKALGREAQGAAMIAAFEAEMAKLSGDEITASAVIYGPNGYSVGADTLSDDLLSWIGFSNISSEQGLTGGEKLPLEKLVLANPDLLVTSKPYPGTSRAEALLAHPALSQVQARAHLQSGAEWTCPTPHLLQAAQDLYAARQTLEVQR